MSLSLNSDEKAALLELLAREIRTAFVKVDDAKWTDCRECRRTEYGAAAKQARILVDIHVKVTGMVPHSDPPAPTCAHVKG